MNVTWDSANNHSRLGKGRTMKTLCAVESCEIVGINPEAVQMMLNHYPTRNWCWNRDLTENVRPPFCFDSKVWNICFEVAWIVCEKSRHQQHPAPKAATAITNLQKGLVLRPTWLRLKIYIPLRSAQRVFWIFKISFFSDLHLVYLFSSFCCLFCLVLLLCCVFFPSFICLLSLVSSRSVVFFLLLWPSWVELKRQKKAGKEIHQRERRENKQK